VEIRGITKIFCIERILAKHVEFRICECKFYHHGGGPLHSNYKKQFEDIREIIKYLQHLVFRLQKMEDGVYLFTFFEGMLAEQLNLSTEYTLGKSPIDIFPWIKGFLLRTLKRIERNRQTVEFELPYKEQIYSVSATPIIDQNEITAIVGIAKDITDRKKAEKELIESEQRFQSLAKATFEGIIIHQDGIILDVNRSIEEMFGYTLQELKGKSAISLALEEFQPLLLEKIHTMDEKPYEAVGLRKDGSTFPAELVAKNSTYNGKPVRVVAVRDISERKKNEKMIQHLAYYDSLTGLPNRTLFHNRLKYALAHAHRNQGKLAVLMLDLDRFKYINDTLGHSIGDQLLQEAANRLRKCIREDDTLSRLGGDEFSILMLEITDVQEVLSVVHQITDVFSQPFLIRDHELYVTVSIGISVYPDDGADGETLVKHADTALFRAKDQGRNNYQLYTPAMNEQALQRLMLENQLRKALARNEFSLHYQPMVNANTGTIVAVEALIRWHHHELGMVSPAHFIPLAEETGLIIPIGEWVMWAACSQCKAWQEMGYPPVRISINLSGRQFAQDNLVDKIAQVLGGTGLDPEYLQIELTESIIMQNAEANVRKLHQLKEMGIQIAIDDFGTGYSSLSYLKAFPIDKLKIDRSFVWEINSNGEEGVIAAAVISLAQSLKLQVVAEGVETKEQVQFLSQRGCYEMQGYLFSKPLTFDAFEKLLATGNPVIHMEA
jgi:diguanylate cyclase (GGDEF)-like protein/PAS domain S-box-containing protein